MLGKPRFWSEALELEKRIILHPVLSPHPVQNNRQQDCPNNPSSNATLIKPGPLAGLNEYSHPPPIPAVNLPVKLPSLKTETLKTSPEARWTSKTVAASAGDGVRPTIFPL